MTVEKMELDVTVAADDGRCDISVRGEFDRLQSDRFDRAVASLPTSVTRVTVDLTGTTIIDSSALGCLIRLRRRLDVDGGRLAVAVATKFQMTVMSVSGLSDYLGAEMVDTDVGVTD